MLVPPASVQWAIQACQMLLVRCLTKVRDPATVDSLKQFQSCVTELEAPGSVGLTEEELERMLKV